MLPPGRVSDTSTFTSRTSPPRRSSIPACSGSTSPCAAIRAPCSSPAGGYHHHIGVNTWAGEGAPAPPPGTRGLRDFAIVLPGSAELDAAEGRLRDAGVEARRDAGGVHAADPSGNGIVLTATQAA